MEDYMIHPHTGKHIPNLIGKKFGRLAVLGFDSGKYIAQNNKCRNTYWMCECECGKLTSVRSDLLTHHKTISCGCYNKDMIREKHSRNLTGMRFGKLIAVRLTDIKDGKANVWECRCDCGTVKNVRSTSLTSGAITSCGCKKMSSGAKNIAEILSTNDIKFVPDFRVDNMYFDFFVDNSYAIEYDGEQHFRESWRGKRQLDYQKSLDARKNEYCKNKGMPLIRIPYWHQNDVVLEDLIPNTSSYLV